MSWARSYNASSRSNVEVAPPAGGRRGIGSNNTMSSFGRSSTYHPDNEPTSNSNGVSRGASFSRRSNIPTSRTPSGFGSERRARGDGGVHTYGSSTPAGQTLKEQITAAEERRTRRDTATNGVSAKESLARATTTYTTTDRLNQPRNIPNKTTRLNAESLADAAAASTDGDSPSSSINGQHPATSSQQAKGRGPFPPAGAGAGGFANRLRKDVGEASEPATNTARRLSRHTSFGSFSQLPRQDSGLRGSNNSSDYYQGLIGFSNLGNTCFMNSTLQCVIRLRAVRSHLIENSAPATLKLQFDRKTPVTAALHDLAQQVFVGSGPNARGSVAPQQVKSAIASFHRAFDGYDQHDAQELLRFLLDAMDIECCRIKKKPPYEELKDIDGEPVNLTAERWLRNHLARNSSFVQDIFCGQFVSTTVCLTCNHVSTSCDVFHDLSLPIAKPKIGASNSSARRTSLSLMDSVPLNDCLSNFFGESTLDPQEHQYICAKCKSPQKAIRNTKLMKCPDVLVVHLKRFRQQRYLRTKIADVVTFPTEEGGLSLRNHLHSTSPEENVSYSLSGIVNHMGSCHGGHYTAYGKAATGGSSWYEFNDSRVDSVSNPDRMISGSAYLLFFERIKSNKL